MSPPLRIPPTQRSTLALLSRQPWWPANRKYPGIANGWQGAAWVAFKLASAGVAVPDRVFDAVARRLTAELDEAPSTRIGAMIGCAAEAVIAAYAAQRGLVTRAVVRAACRRVHAMVRRSDAWDLHVGLSGTLLAFLEIAAVEPSALGAFQPRPLVDRLRAQVDALCTLPPTGWHTGMAHGPAGAMMALEACGAAGWCRITTGRRQRWLDLLSRSALASEGGGLFWPATAGAQELGLQSWCAGTPGIALALLQCFRLTHEAVYLEVAREALEGMKLLFGKPFFSPTLCCGSAGYRHIFVEAYRVTGEDAWLVHARREARLAPSATSRPRLGLHQGELGIAYLADRLANPRALPFPALGAFSL